jgi:phosphate transport system substrate-binding protein
VRAPRFLIASLLVAAALVAPANAFGKRLIIDGSTSMLPLVQKLGAAYHKATHKPDPKGLIFTKVARDGVCVITNGANPIPNLSQELITGIFTGSIRDWSRVPGAGVSGPIDLFDRDAASGTQDAFQQIFLGESLKISPSATPESSEGLEVSSVGADKSAIGFTSFAATLNSGVHTVNFGGIPCNLRNAKSGQYGGVRNFWFVTKGIPKGEARKFIEWVVKPGNKTVRSIVSSEWIAIH